MPAYDIEADGHRFRVWNSAWTGRERIEVDGAPVSEAVSWRLITPHHLNLQREGRTVAYELLNGSFLGYSLRRDGAVLSERYRPVVGFLLGFGFTYLPLIVAFDLIAAVWSAAPDPSVWIEEVFLLIALGGGVVWSRLLRRRLAGALRPAPASG